jgi:phytanoyl-CoA hydroxylase
LSQSAKQEFDADGYVMLRGFLNPNEVSVLHAKLATLIQNIVPTMPSEAVFYEDKSRPDTLKQLQHLEQFGRDYFQEMFSGRFSQLAADLMGDRAVGKNLQYFNKPPAVGQPTPPHQDGYYFKIQPCEAVTMWLALDVVDEENGCVRYVRGSHKRGMRPHARTGVLGFSQGITDFGSVDDQANEIAIPAQPGDLLVHHALTIHRADGNSSAARSRRSLGFIYYAERAQEDAATVNEYQQTLKSELVASGKI